MKRAKLIPSIIMLILCLSVLCVGIYAVTPTTNNIVGTINLIASNPEIEITAYLGTDKATQISDTVTGRTSKTINLYANTLEFVEPEGTNPVADLTLVIEIKNNSTAVDVGAFFLNGTELPETITSSHVLRSATFDGVNASKTKTVEDIMAISFPAYTKVAKGATVDLVCTLSVEELYEEELTSSLELPLVINEYQSSLANIAVTAVSHEESGTEADTAVTVTGSGSFIVGDEVTLTAQPNTVDESLIYTYIWYSKNAFGVWEVVTDSDSTDSTYTFTMSAISPTEYKVVYTTTKVYTITLSYECSGDIEYIDEVVLSGGGTKQHGEKFQPSANITMFEKADVVVTLSLEKKVDGEWVYMILPNPFNSPDSGAWSITDFSYYELTVDENTPLEYRFTIDVYCNGDNGDVM